VARQLRLTLAQRDIAVASSDGPRTWASSEAGVYGVSLDPKDADGVLIATLSDDKGTPLAERLIYRRPAKSIKIEMSPNQPAYVPGDKASITLKATDDAGRPVAAVVGLTVTDESVLEMIETREQAPRLPAMVLLEPDVTDLADAHVYLDPANPKASLATDLLLGTQGWRRFAFVDPAKFLADHADAAKRVWPCAFPRCCAKGSCARTVAHPMIWPSRARRRRPGHAHGRHRGRQETRRSAAPRPADQG